MLIIIGVMERARGGIITPGYIRKSFDINISRIGVVIMDPWKNTGDSFMDNKVDDNIKNEVCPLLDNMISKGLNHIFVFSNDPETVDCKDGSLINDDIQKYIDEGRAELCYHHHYSLNTFCKELSNKSIEALIYMGYATNMCILYRPTGIIPVHNCYRKIRIFLCPDTTYALVNHNESDNIKMRECISIMLSQNDIAGIIQKEYLFNLD